MGDRPRITLAPRDGSHGMDPDEFLIHHRAMHERQQTRLWLLIVVFSALAIAVLAMVALAYR